jgi:hypothetical protein
LLGVALLKFGNPVIFDQKIPAPKNLAEWLIYSWPMGYAYTIFGLVLAAGIVIGGRNRAKTPWIAWLPGLWLAWEALATFQTSNRSMSDPIFIHFAACVCLFYLGWHNSKPGGSIIAILSVIFVAFIVVVRNGFEQHFGGLSAARAHFFMYVYPTLKNPPADLIKRMSTTRIFSTLFYPNTLAGAILLYVPLMICLLLRAREFLRPAILFTVGTFSVSSAAVCLFWSGSKTGWLLFLLLSLVALFHAKFDKRNKALSISVLLLLGVSGFIIKNKAFFDRGATSVVARSDYWGAALKIGLGHPLFGTGPGTFGSHYLKIMPAGGEPSRLAHNDYLEQFCDSGFVGFATYFAFITGSMVALYRKSAKSIQDGNFWIWLGLLGLCLHSCVEFHLYIPALAWPLFFFFGRQWGVEMNRHASIPALR